MVKTNNNYKLTAVSTNKCAYIFLCTSLLTIPINVSYYQIVRIADIFIIASFILCLKCKPLIKSNLFAIYLAMNLVFIISSYLSLLSNNNLRITGLAFYYKYLLIFIIPVIVIVTVNNKIRLFKIITILYYLYILLNIWVYIYYWLRINEYIIASQRISYPLSDYTISDAHVFSSYLSFTLIAYLEYVRIMLRHSIIRSYIIVMLSIGALFMTGSKTGILILALYTIYIVIRNICYLRKKNVINLIITIIITSLIFTFVIYSNINIKEDIIYLYERTTTYDLEDASINRRYLYLRKAIDEASQNYLLFGKGPTASNQKWYDGGLSIVIAHGGLLGVFVMVFYIFCVIKEINILSRRSNSKYLRKVFLLLLFTYILLSLITEHFLITRNVLPVVTLLSIIYVNIKLNYNDSYII